jgi:hypothetical protein
MGQIGGSLKKMVDVHPMMKEEGVGWTVKTLSPPLLFANIRTVDGK